MDQSRRTSQPLIVLTFRDPSAVLGKPDRTSAPGVALYDRKLPRIELGVVFYKLYTTQDAQGNLRDYPVCVAWHLAAAKPSPSGGPSRLPANMILLVGMLALAFTMIRRRLRKDQENTDDRWQYRPRRYSFSDKCSGGPCDSPAPPSESVSPEAQGGLSVAPALGSQPMERLIKVNLGERSYDVRIGPGELDRLGPTAAGMRGVHSAVVIADATVAELYGRRAVDSLESAGVGTALIDFPPGEEHKTLATFGHVMDELLAVSPPIERDSLIVALGGGVTGDLAGFVAATALRGLRWLACPTTLLADVDASVGGKTAVDHPTGKNLIGAFHQPSGVLIDVSALKTLDAQQIRTGLAECVKHGMIREATLLDFIERNAAAILAAEESVMTELIARNVAIKAAIVSADERESGQRSHLNFGHTVGHAIETHLGLGKIAHGATVSLGMVVACHLAANRGLVKPPVLDRLKSLLKLLGLPVCWPGLDVNALWSIMQHDKKVRAGKVRMALPTALGQVDLFDDIRQQEIADALAAMQG